MIIYIYAFLQYIMQTWVYTYTCVHDCTYTRTYCICDSGRIYIYIYIYIYIHIHTYTHIDTYTCTHAHIHMSVPLSHMPLSPPTQAHAHVQRIDHSSLPQATYGTPRQQRTQCRRAPMFFGTRMSTWGGTDASRQESTCLQGARFVTCTVFARKVCHVHCICA
jgi:hypothetical protein